MRIMKSAQFMTMPAGTIYAVYKPTIFYTWQVKQETNSLNFSSRELVNVPWKTFDELPYDASVVDPDKSFPIDLITGELEDMFDENRLYAVLEPHDVKALISSLQNAHLESQGITQVLGGIEMPMDLADTEDFNL